MFGIGVFEIIIILAAVLVSVVPFWVIFTKAGFTGPLSIFMPVPVLNVIILYYVAFSRWPAHRQSERVPSPYDPIHPS